MSFLLITLPLPRLRRGKQRVERSEELLAELKSISMIPSNGFHVDTRHKTHVFKWMFLPFLAPFHKQYRIYHNIYASYLSVQTVGNVTARSDREARPTYNNPPLHQLCSFDPPRPCIFQRCATPVLALQPQLVFRRQLRHVRRPLAFGFICAVVVVFRFFFKTLCCFGGVGVFGAGLFGSGCQAEG